ncbi:PAS domain S-box protein [Spirulina subsalsa FACHB-351]|uniref:histidine kinase n=1 Tax=Spirulina subsalsa FACHB-351 TaxID=234711 RepID=A0ABT3L975_9CYAN|nr:PAS domain S-box protein [Spirulina subsalsa]MCW6038061.1 PAS domain S-box protein [Spirulina subsalsa FACHB-351]
MNNFAEPIKILIVEENPTDLCLLLEQLNGHDYQITVAKTPANGVKLAHSLQPDVILLGFQVAKTTDYKFCKDIRKKSNFCDRPIIFIGALLSETDRQKVYEVGGCDYILRPFCGEEVRRRIEGQVMQARFSQQMAQQQQQLKQERATRKASEERLRLLERAIANSTNGITIVDAQDPDYPLVYVNSGFERITGYKAEEVLGRNCRFLQGRDRQQPERKKLKEAIAQGKATQVLLRNYRKDGTLFWNELNISPVHDEIGQVTHFIGVQTDISEHIEIEERLKTLLQTQRAMLQAIPDLLIRIRRDGTRLGIFNAEQVHIIPSNLDDPVGGNITEALPPHLAQTRLHYINQALDTGELQIYQQTVELNGEIYYEECRVIPCGEDEALVIVRDVTEQVTTQQRLQELLQTHEATLAALPDLLLHLRRDGTRLAVYNPHHIRLIDPDCLKRLGNNVRDVLPPDLAEKRLAATEQALNTGQLQIYEQELIIEGKLVYEECRVVPCREDEALIIVRDITEQKAALREREQIALALQESERKKQAILSAIPDLMFCLNDQGIYTDFVNSPYTKSLNPKEQWIGKCLDDLPDPPVAQRQWDALQKVLRNGKREVYEQRVLVQGKWQDEEVQMVKLNDHEVLLMIRDITERKQVAARLQESEARFRSAFDDAAIGMALVSTEGRLIRVNQSFCQLFGYNKTELLQMHCKDLTHPDDLPKTEEALEDLLQNRIRVYQEEKRYIHKQGHVIWAVSNISLVRNDAGEALYFTAQIQDISDLKRAELEAQERETQLRILGDNLPKGCIYRMVRDPDGRYYFSYITAGIEQLVGVTPEQVIADGSILYNLIIEEDRPLHQRLTQESLDNLSVFEMQMRKYAPDGSIQWSQICSSPRRLEDGRVIWDGIEVDITDLKETEEQLRESEARFRSAFDDAGTGMALVAPDGRCLRVNRTLCDMLGYSEAELLALNVQDITHPDDWIVDLNLGTQVLEGKLRTYNLEKRYFSKTGEVIWILLTVSLVRDLEGNPLYFVSQIQDIRDRKQAEAKLRENEERLRSIASNIPGMLYTLVDYGNNVLKFEYSSEGVEELCQVTLEAVYEDANVLLEQIHPEDQAGYRHAAERSVQEWSSFSHEWRHILPSGEMIWLMGKSRPVRRPNGVIAWNGIVLNITTLKEIQGELEKAKEAAEAANRAKSTFLANMSHELRSPLNAILGFAQVLDGAENLTPAQQENLHIIRQSGEHLLGLINDILDISKIEAGQITVHPEDCHLSRILDELYNLFRLKAQQKQLQFRISQGEGVPEWIYCDRLKLRQILINLLSNALKFTHKGSVHFYIEKTPLPAQTLSPYSPEAGQSLIQLAFTVQDTGIGIRSEEVSQLFNPFVQSESGIQSQQGTGLGLAISQRYAKLMGGEITLQSQWQQGSKFTLTLPILTSFAQTPAPSSSPKQIIGLAPNQPEYRILVVDDHPPNRQLMQQILTPLGFIVREAHNGQEAIEQWQQFNPHLIWMDLRMPILDGYEATQKIRQIEAQQKIKNPVCIIALTASAFDEQKQQALDLGCNDFIHKPLEISKILSTMAEYLEINYTYAEEIPINSINQDTEFYTEQFLHLSEDWKNQMLEAIFSLDLSQIQQLVQEIGEQEPELTELLKTYVNNYDYNSILTLLGDSNE